MKLIRTLGLAASSILSIHTASAHLSYPATRDFGTFTLANPQSVTVSNQTTKAFGWADGTDANFAAQDNQRYLKFTLEATTTITITITADPANLLPAFSIYQGVGHGATDASNPDYDGAAVTQAYLAGLGAPQPRLGAFDALHTFKIGNDSNAAANYVAELVTFTYMGNAADGTASNFGPASGINGDGTADGIISGTFTLPAGPYTLAVGGANYSSADTVSRPFIATVTSVPEPSTALLGVCGTAALALIRRRRSSVAGTCSPASHSIL